jgi:hypothetical protein
VIRRAHRTLIARVLSACLLILAASPLTAPFSVIDSADFGQSQPSDAHHPAHDMAEAQVKVSGHLVVAAPDMTPLIVATICAHHLRGLRPVPLATAPPTFSAVLRL